MIFGLLTALQALTLYILIIVPAEFFLTEQYQIYKFINARTKTLVFLIIFLVVFLINYFFIHTKNFWWLIVALFFLSLIGFARYQYFHWQWEQIPDIYSISSNWTIQGKKIIIDGKDFGDPHNESKVVVGDINFLIHKWSHQEIIAVQPITGNFGKDELYVIRHNGKKSEPIPFEIKDPANLYN